MVERRSGARFLFKPVEPVRIVGERSGQHLERDLAIEPRVERTPNYAHAVRAELTENAIVSDLVGCCHRLLTGLLFHFADQHDIAVNRPACDDELFAIAGNIEGPDLLIFEIRHGLGRATI